MERPDLSVWETRIAAMLRQTEAMIANSTFLKADQKLPDSLWRTIIGNKVERGASPAPPEFVTKYQALRNILFNQRDETQDPDTGAQLIKDYQTFLHSWEATSDTTFCITRSGMMAKAPRYGRRQYLYHTWRPALRNLYCWQEGRQRVLYLDRRSLRSLYFWQWVSWYRGRLPLRNHGSLTTEHSTGKSRTGQQARSLEKDYGVRLVITMWQGGRSV